MLTNAHVTSLRTDETGRVIGVKYRKGGEGAEGGEDIEMPTAAVVLTTGGTLVHSSHSGLYTRIVEVYKIGSLT